MVGIVNYGAGNLYSVRMAIKNCGYESCLITGRGDAGEPDVLVLPGVGAFGDGMQNLRAGGLDVKIRKFIECGKPFLGICLGLQLLFPRSEESACGGLGILEGSVIRLPDTGDIDIPHMGWNEVDWIDEPGLFCGGIPRDACFYFAHSYHAAPEDRNVVAATTLYGRSFPSVLHYRNVTAVQFHPEKSGRHGLRFLHNFLEGAC